MLDLWSELLERMGDLPVSRPFDAAAVAAAAALPIRPEPLSVAELAALLRPLVMEQSTLCGHPGFMAYVSGSGTVPGAAADLLAAGAQPQRRRLEPLARCDRARAAPDALAWPSSSASPPAPAA